MPASASLEESLIEDIAGFEHDLLGFVEYAYPWAEPGDLADFERDREWQIDLLRVIGQHLSNPETRYVPLLIAVASGHGIGKSKKGKRLRPYHKILPVFLKILRKDIVTKNFLQYPENCFPGQ